MTYTDAIAEEVERVWPEDAARAYAEDVAELIQRLDDETEGDR